MIELPGDNLDYDIIFKAASSIKHVPGIICEIGTRRGGSLKYIIDALLSVGDHNRNVVCIDPYGDIGYRHADNIICTFDYTNTMRDEAWANIYAYVQGKPINLIFQCLEDTEFFNRFQDGVPVYQQHGKQIINQYSLVYFDGPHDTESISKEIDFFIPRSTYGTKFIFDDIVNYNHTSIHNRLLNEGFALVEYSTDARRASYTKN